MAVKAKVGLVKDGWVPSPGKKLGKDARAIRKLAPTSRNGRKKAYRGQGR